MKSLIHQPIILQECFVYEVRDDQGREYQLTKLYQKHSKIFKEYQCNSKERVFSKEPKYWRFSISPSNEYSGLISLRLTGFIPLQSKGLSKVFANATVQKHQFFSAQFSLWFNSHIHM